MTKSRIVQISATIGIALLFVYVFFRTESFDVLLVGLLCLITLKLGTAVRELKAIKESLERREAWLLESPQPSAGMDRISPVNSEKLERVLERLPLDHESKFADQGGPEDKLPAPVDRERVYEALGDDPKELLGLYLSDMNRNFEELATAIEAGRAHEINSIAHNCAGVSSTCGIIAMVAPFRELERMGRENELDGAAALGIQTRATFERVKEFVLEEFEGVAVPV